MTNLQLNELSLIELRDLAQRVNQIYKAKLTIDGIINSQSLEVGMTVQYTGAKCSISNEYFIIEKINKVNATCRNTITGIRWDLKLGNIKQV